METIERNGTVYVLVPRDAWQKLVSGDVVMPDLPPADAKGNRDAIAYARASIARSIIRGRTALGWTQAELARQSGVPVETLNRIEKARVTPDESTIKRLDKVLSHPPKKVSTKLRTPSPTGRRPSVGPAASRRAVG